MSNRNQYIFWEILNFCRLIYSQVASSAVFVIFLWFVIFGFGCKVVIVHPGVGSWAEYLTTVIFYLTFSLGMWIYQVSIHYLQFYISALFDMVSITMFGICGFLSAITALFSFAGVFGDICLNMFGYFTEFLRILVIMSIYPSSYYEVRRRGTRFNTIFGFRPLASRYLSSAGVAYRALLMLEVVLFQLLHGVFQTIWIGFSIPYHMVVFATNSIFAGAYVGTFTVINMQMLQGIVLPWDSLVGVILVSIPILILILRSMQIDRIRNFFNFQSLFAFVVPNRWFASNFFPGSSFFSSCAGVIRARGRLIGSVLRRFESLIVFTSQLRLDPKQVDLSYW